MEEDIHDLEGLTKMGEYLFVDRRGEVGPVGGGGHALGLVAGLGPPRLGSARPRRARARPSPRSPGARAGRAPRSRPRRARGPPAGCRRPPRPGRRRGSRTARRAAARGRGPRARRPGPAGTPRRAGPGSGPPPISARSSATARSRRRWRPLRSPSSAQSAASRSGRLSPSTSSRARRASRWSESASASTAREQPMSKRPTAQATWARRGGALDGVQEARQRLGVALGEQQRLAAGGAGALELERLPAALGLAGEARCRAASRRRRGRGAAPRPARGSACGPRPAAARRRRPARSAGPPRRGGLAVLVPGGLGRSAHVLAVLDREAAAQLEAVGVQRQAGQRGHDHRRRPRPARGSAPPRPSPARSAPRGSGSWWRPRRGARASRAAPARRPRPRRPCARIRRAAPAPSARAAGW